MTGQVTPLFEIDRPVLPAAARLIADSSATIEWYRNNGFDGSRWAARLAYLEYMVAIIPTYRPGTIALQAHLKVLGDKLAELPEPIVEASDDDVEFEGDRIRDWLRAATDLQDETESE